MNRLLAAVQRVASLGVAPADDDRQRLAKGGLTLVVTLVCALSPVWIGTYLALGRPLPAAIPATYVVISLGTLAHLALTKDPRIFYATHIGLILVLPFALQWSLGGFVSGSGVALWAFAAPLAALVVWGARAAATVMGLFVVGVLASGALEPWLRDAVPPLPAGVTNAFLVLNVIAPMTTAFVSVMYFMRQRDLAAERSEQLLLNVLPERVASRLKAGAAQVADRVEGASVLFVDIADFTPFAERTAPERVVALLSRIFSTLDALTEEHGLDKIKTLGDGYLAAGLSGNPVAEVRAAASMALQVVPALRSALGNDWPGFEVRVGIASGPVVAGVIGARRFSYDLWGDTVNTASRMTASAAPGTVQVSDATRQLLGEGWPVTPLGRVVIKGKGVLTTYRLTGPPRDGA